MNAEQLLKALRSGEPVYGTRVVSTSPLWPQATADAGIDFVFLDLEHIPLSRERLTWMCSLFEARGVVPIVRIYEPNPNLATAALDGGAAGIIAPYIETVEQARVLRGAVKLRPLKGEKLHAVLSQDAQPNDSIRDYLNANNKSNLLFLNIESEPALNNLEKILAVPGIDALLVGPHDLTVNLGVPEQYDHPRFREAISLIIRSARENKVAAGVHFFADVNQQIAWIKEGANIIVHATDVELFRDTLKRDIAEMRRSIT